MADEPKKDGPDHYPTKQIPQLTDRALLEDLTRVVKSGFGEVRLLRADVDLLVGDLASLKVDVRELQKWKIGSEERQEKHSGGLQQNSSVNLKQDAVLADVVMRLDRVETSVSSVEAKTDVQTAMLTRAEKAATALWSNKAVQGAVIGLIVAAATAGTAFLTHLGGR